MDVFQSVEVKLPTVWTDGKAEVARVREEKGRRKNVREEKVKEPQERRCRLRKEKSQDTRFCKCFVAGGSTR